jgi:hypothetical protein
MDFQTTSGITSSYDDLLELLKCLGIFFKRLKTYMIISPTPISMEIVVRIFFELLSVLALASKQIKQGRFSKYAVTCTLFVDLMCLRELPERVTGGDRGRSPKIGSINPSPNIGSINP